MSEVQVGSVAPEVAVDTSPEISTEGEGVVEEAVSGESDPNESYSSWMKRQDEKVSKAKKPDITIAPDVKESTSLKEDVKTPHLKSVKLEESPKAPIEQVLKVKDKTYKSEDVERLDTENADLKAKEATTTKQLADLVNILKTDPGKILDRLEVSRETLEKYYYQKYLEQDTLTAEQKLERYQKADEERKSSEKEAEQTRQQQAQEQQNRVYWTGKIKEALVGEGLPETQWTVNRMAGYIKQSIDQKLNTDHKELAKLVKEDIVKAQKAALEGLTPEQLVQTLGPEAIGKLRQHETDKFKQTKFENRNPSKGKVEKEKKPGKKYSSPYDLVDDI